MEPWTNLFGREVSVTFDMVCVTFRGIVCVAPSTRLMELDGISVRMSPLGKFKSLLTFLYKLKSF